LSLGRLLFRLRPEEAVALAFLLPTTWLTVAAYLYAREVGELSSRYPGAVYRLAVVVALALYSGADYFRRFWREVVRA